MVYTIHFKPAFDDFHGLGFIPMNKLPRFIIGADHLFDLLLLFVDGGGAHRQTGGSHSDHVRRFGQHVCSSFSAMMGNGKLIEIVSSIPVRKVAKTDVVSPP